MSNIKWVAKEDITSSGKLRTEQRTTMSAVGPRVRQEVMLQAISCKQVSKARGP